MLFNDIDDIKIQHKTEIAEMAVKQEESNDANATRYEK